LNGAVSGGVSGNLAKPAALVPSNIYRHEGDEEIRAAANRGQRATKGMFGRPAPARQLPIFVLNAPDLLPSRGADNLLQEVIFR
jgi:hypothetical protein